MSIRKKKVLMLLKSNISNDSRVIKEASLLNDNNYEVHVIFKIRKNENYKTNFKFNIIPISYPLVNTILPFKIFNHIFTSIKFIIKGIKLKPNIVHSHDHNTLSEGAIISFFTHSKLVYDSHELWSERVPIIVNGRKNIKRIFMRKIEKFAEKILCLRVNCIITVSDSIKNKMFENLLVRKDIQVVSNFYSKKDVKKFSSNIYHELYPDTIGRKIFLYRDNIDIGNFDYPVLGALSKLDSVILAILGNFNNNEKNFIYEILESERKKMIFIPQVPFQKMQEFIYFSDVGLYIKKNVCKNIYYSLPNKIFEYLAFGKPIISSNLLEIEKIVKLYNIGEIYIEGDRNSFLNAANKLLDDDYYRVIQNNVKESFSSHLNWEKESKKLLEVYRSFS